MTDILPSVTETQALTALRSAILTVVGCEVVRAQNNRVAMPAGDFIALTPRGLMPLSVPIDGYTATTQTIKRPVQFTVQIDCYGSLAMDRANSIGALLRDVSGADLFVNSGYDVQTLYAGDAKQLPLIDGEEQYEERWTFDAVLQMNPVITIAAQTANMLTIGLVNVDAVYPPQ